MAYMAYNASTSNWSPWDTNLLCRQCSRLIEYGSEVYFLAGFQPVLTIEDPDQPQICCDCFAGTIYLNMWEGVNAV